MLRTDLAVELVKGGKVSGDKKVRRSDLVIDEKMSARCGKAPGAYTTIESTVVVEGDTREYKRLTRALSDAIEEHTAGASDVLVVGLGNPELTADALGSEVFKNLNVTRHLTGGLDHVISLSALCPNVLGVTGIESYDVVKGVVERTKPSAVIVVDSLASAAVSRIGTAFQISTGGITPGSGVSNHRMRLDQTTLGVRVVSVGVPLVVYASTIIAEACRGVCDRPKLSEDIENLIVTPKDIDILVADCGKIIAGAINAAFVGDMD